MCASNVSEFKSLNNSDTSNVWTTLHSILISKSANSSKWLSLKHPQNDKDFILADLRVFYGESPRPTRCGVCLTQFEFDYLTKVLLYARTCKQKLTNKTGTRILTISPKTNIGGVEICHTLNDKIRRISLTGVDCIKIAENYSIFYDLVDEAAFEDIPEEVLKSLDLPSNKSVDQTTLFDQKQAETEEPPTSASTSEAKTIAEVNHVSDKSQDETEAFTGSIVQEKAQTSTSGDNWSNIKPGDRPSWGIDVSSITAPSDTETKFGNETSKYFSQLLPHLITPRTTNFQFGSSPHPPTVVSDIVPQNTQVKRDQSDASHEDGPPGKKALTDKMHFASIGVPSLSAGSFKNK